MRQVHEMKQSTLAMSCVYLGAFGVVAGASLAFSEKAVPWLLLSAVGLVAFVIGALLRQKDLTEAYRVYLQQEDLEDVKAARNDTRLDAKSLALIKEELVRRKAGV